MAVVRRKQAKREAAGFNSRAAGIVLVAFFALGVATGLSERGREIAHRASIRLKSHTSIIAAVSTRAHDALAQLKRVFEALESALGLADASARTSARASKYSSSELHGKAVALVARRDGFYMLLATGELRGPISPNAGEDLPILSGAGAVRARGERMVEYAALLVRAEAELSHMISEMRVDDDGTAALFLDRFQTEVIIDLDHAPLQIRRAAEMLHRFDGREHHLAVLDMTTPGQAVVRLTAPIVAPPRVAGRIEQAAAYLPAPPGVAAPTTRSP